MFTPTVEQTSEWCELINSTENCNRHVLLHKLCRYISKCTSLAPSGYMFFKKGSRGVWSCFDWTQLVRSIAVAVVNHGCILYSHQAKKDRYPPLHPTLNTSSKFVCPLFLKFFKQNKNYRQNFHFFVRIEELNLSVHDAYANRCTSGKNR